MGDDNDQARLASMTEKEREEELFNRNERREVMRTRWDFLAYLSGKNNANLVHDE